MTEFKKIEFNERQISVVIIISNVSKEKVVPNIDHVQFR